MYSLKIDKEKNRIYIFIKDKLENEEMAKYTQELLQLIDQTEYGFTVCADIRQADISILENSENFQPIRKYGEKKGLKAAIEIMNENQINVHSRHPVIGMKNVVTNEEEAEKFFNNIK